MNITTGKITTAQKVVVYGVEGIGKSEIASKFKQIVFIDTENSTSHLNVSRLDKPATLQMFFEQIDWLGKNISNHGYKTLAIDTMDWLEQLAKVSVTERAGMKSFGDFDWGKGYDFLYNEIARILDRLSWLSDRGMNVILLAHSHVKTVNLPEQSGAFDRYELKLEKKSSAFVKEWSDALFFLNYKTNVFEDKDKKKKATGGRRTIYTTRSTSWDGKNRYNLEDFYDFEDKPELLASLIEPHFMLDTVGHVVDVSPIKVSVLSLIKSAGIEIQQIEEFAWAKGHFPNGTNFDSFPDSYLQTLINNFDKVKIAIKGN